MGRVRVLAGRQVERARVSLASWLDCLPVSERASIHSSKHTVCRFNVVGCGEISCLVGGRPDPNLAVVSASALPWPTPHDKSSIPRGNPSPTLLDCQTGLYHQYLSAMIRFILVQVSSPCASDVISDHTAPHTPST